MRLFGLIRHSPDELIVELLKINKRPYYFFLPFGSVLPLDGVKEKIILMPNMTDFKRTYRALNTEAYKNKDVFVFGSELSLSEYTNITLLDATYNSVTDIEPDENIDLEKYKSKPKHIGDIVRTQGIYVNTLIDASLQNSVFNNLMTFIYTLPAKTHQKPITVVSCAYLRNNLSIRQFNNSLDKLRKEISITPRVSERLTEILTTPQAVRMRSAFEDLPAYDRELIEDVALKHNVYSFELSYVIKMLDNEKEYVKHTKKSIDDKMRKK